MEIYFDDKLINEDYYTALSTNFALFGDTFYLGSTASNIYNISIAKEAITTHPSTVLVKDNGALIATLVVDKVEENDFEYKYTLTDKMVNLEFNYDASESFTNGSATLLEIAQDICNKAGIELATMDFRGYNKGINWYDNTRTAREYIGYIAELNGGYAQIGKDGRLYFIKQNTLPAKIISIDDCADFKIGEKHVISRVVYEQGTLKYEYGDETGNTLYLSGDNVYITEQIEVEEIFNEINGFEFYSFSTSNCPIDYSIMAGQIVTFTDGINSYPTIVGYELTYNGDWYGGYNLDVATKKQEETQVTGTSEKIRNLAIKVDRESNKITQAIQEIDDQNQKISVVEQTVNELNSKIGDIADITASQETLNGTVSFEKVNQSEPIYVKIYPTGKNISYLYPRDNLYPSDTLYPTGRTLRFTNTTTEESVDYELPTDLLYYDAENYDEFILDYDAQSCVINKRVGYNADGTTYLLDTVQTIEYNFPRILLTDGDYTVTLLGYHNAYMFVRLMAQNIYTTQFATKAELNSEISQTESKINLSVNEKLESYPTTTQMNSAISVTAEQINSEVSKKVGEDEIISKINQTAENITINANRINFNGAVSANGNFLIDTAGNMHCSNATITKGSINIIDTENENTSNLTITSADGSENWLKSDRSYMYSKNPDVYISNRVCDNNGEQAKSVWMGANGTFSSVSHESIVSPTLFIDENAYAKSFIQTSKESTKKNIVEYSENALEIVKNSEIYEYNFKNENDQDKKHIGFVIGDEGGKYKTPEHVISNDREGIENYSMTSILWKAVQEQQTIIEQLQNEIKELKGENKDGQD